MFFAIASATRLALHLGGSTVFIVCSRSVTETNVYSCFSANSHVRLLSGTKTRDRRAITAEVQVCAFLESVLEICRHQELRVQKSIYYCLRQDGQTMPKHFCQNSFPICRLGYRKTRQAYHLKSKTSAYKNSLFIL